MYLNELGKMMRTVGDEHRLSILCYLMRHTGPCVSDIASHLDMSIATASHHLRVLAKEGLVQATRDGKRICYTLPRSPLVRNLRKFICAHTEL